MEIWYCLDKRWVGGWEVGGVHKGGGVVVFCMEVGMSRFVTVGWIV